MDAYWKRWVAPPAGFIDSGLPGPIALEQRTFPSPGYGAYITQRIDCKLRRAERETEVFRLAIAGDVADRWPVIYLVPRKMNRTFKEGHNSVQIDESFGFIVIV